MESRNKLEMLKLDMLHENEGRTNIFKADHFFQTKLVRGTNIFSDNFGPRTIIKYVDVKTPLFVLLWKVVLWQVV